MFTNLKILTEDYFDKYCVQEQNYFDQDFTKDSDKFNFEFGDELFNLFQSFIKDELLENFSSLQNAKYHFNKHCNKQSIRQSVSYDFVNINDYINYEKEISDKCNLITSEDKMFIEDLADYNKVIIAFRKLFEGNMTLVFGLTCGFTNNVGPVRLCINSFSSDKTTNYKANNTVNFLIQAPDKTTLTLYPVDADYIRNKINSQIIKLNISTNKNYKLL